MMNRPILVEVEGGVVDTWVVECHQVVQVCFPHLPLFARLCGLVVKLEWCGGGVGMVWRGVGCCGVVVIGWCVFWCDVVLLSGGVAVWWMVG